MGQPPAELTFHRFCRPDMSVVNKISLPSGDHEALETDRVKYRSSRGIRRALGFEAEVINCGSVIWRSSAPDDWANNKTEKCKEKKTATTRRRRSMFRCSPFTDRSKGWLAAAPRETGPSDQ